jgi:hypothetical protein
LQFDSHVCDQVRSLSALCCVEVNALPRACLYTYSAYILPPPIHTHSTYTHSRTHARTHTHARTRAARQDAGLLGVAHADAACSSQPAAQGRPVRAQGRQQQQGTAEGGLRRCGELCSAAHPPACARHTTLALCLARGSTWHTLVMLLFVATGRCFDNAHTHIHTPGARERHGAGRGRHGRCGAARNSKAPGGVSLWVCVCVCVCACVCRCERTLHGCGRVYTPCSTSHRQQRASCTLQHCSCARAACHEPRPPCPAAVCPVRCAAWLQGVRAHAQAREDAAAVWQSHQPRGECGRCARCACSGVWPSVVRVANRRPQAPARAFTPCVCAHANDARVCRRWRPATCATRPRSGRWWQAWRPSAAAPARPPSPRAGGVRVHVCVCMCACACVRAAAAAVECRSAHTWGS